MTGDDLARTATVETTHADAEAAATIAAAISPDNTDDIRTEADGATVATRVTRDTTGGFLASVDDYLVNLGVADDVVATGRGTEDDTNDADGIRDTNDADGIRDTNDADGIRDTAETRDTADADTHDT
ncbi:KEOPS complex subunit Pcc1 [Halobaculum rarum]|uniref:KEOPS complex subunit Pcc1 n=1 Tax=Halobaculum rarum TaxID=3075122 RepID=UPI0032AF9DD5